MALACFFVFFVVKAGLKFPAERTGYKVVIT